MKRRLLFLAMIQLSVSGYCQIIADHTVVERYDDIPQSYIDEIKKMWLVVPGESHSAGYRNGLNQLESQYPKYAVSVIDAGTPEAYTNANLRQSRATWGDLNNETGWIYNYGEEDWYTSATAISRTKAGLSYCHANNLTIGAIGFAHCYEDGGGDYLTVTQSYIEYCKTNNIPTTVFFTTGPVDSYLALADQTSYNNYLREKAIRDYVTGHSGTILFDYADILSWDNDGVQKTVTFNGNTFPVGTALNTGENQGGHITYAGQLRLAKAMWWMLARIAGWDGVVTGAENTASRQALSISVDNNLGELRIQKADMFLHGDIRLINMNGVAVRETKIISPEFILNTSNLQSGMYFVIISRAHLVETKKIIIIN